MPTWPTTITRIYNGDPGNEDTFSRPINQLADRTEYLRAMVDGFATKSVTLLQNVPIDAAVTLGMAVYYDSSANLYKPALAAWSSTYGPVGQLLPADSARVVGVVTAVNRPNGDILMVGKITSEEVVEGLLGVGAAAGIYYLSDTADGEAQATLPGLVVPVALYDGEGSLVVLGPKPESVSHFHTWYQLEESWLAANSTNFPGMTIPDGALFGYDIENDPDLFNLFTVYHGELTMFADGELVSFDTYTVNTDNIWIMSGSAPATPTFVFAYSPFSAGEPLIRAVLLTTPDEMTATAENGILSLGMKAWSDDTTADSATALSTVVGRKRYKTPVVSRLLAGPGASVADMGAGVHQVSLASLVDSLTDVDLVNLDNAITTTDGTYTFLTLPSGRTSSILGRIPIPVYGEDESEPAELQAKAFVIFRGSAGGCNLAADLTHIAAPEVGSPVAMASATTVATTLIDAGATSSANLYLVLSAAAVEVTSGGTVYLKVAASSPSVDKNIFRVGVVFENAP